MIEFGPHEGLSAQINQLEAELKSIKDQDTKFVLEFEKRERRKAMRRLRERLNKLKAERQERFNPRLI